VCSSCPRLQILDLLGGFTRIYLNSGGWDSDLDHRVVAQEYQVKFYGDVEDWEASYFGLADICSRAEATIEQRKALSGNE